MAVKQHGQMQGPLDTTAPDQGRRDFITGMAVGVPTTLSMALAACADGGSSSAPATAQALATKLVAAPAAGASTVRIQQRKATLVPGFTPTQNNAWVYALDGVTPGGVLNNYLGPTFENRRAAPRSITWVNEIPAMGAGSRLMMDPPCNPGLPNSLCGDVVLQSNVGVVTHLHGARVGPLADGNPVQPLGFAGNPYGFPVQATYTYPNDQRATMLWYHDHALDNTSQHVFAGLAGLYFVRDAFDDYILSLIGGKAKELPLVIQDRVLRSDYTAFDYSGMIVDNGVAARPEALGDQIHVNGAPVTQISVSRSCWRLRLLNGSNARTYAIALCDLDALRTGTGKVWYSDALRLIGADGGLNSVSVPLAATDNILLASGQRRDVLLDLTKIPASVKRLRLVNLALRPAMGADANNPEGIYTTYADTVIAPTSANWSAADSDLYWALTFPIAFIMQMQLPVVSAAQWTALQALSPSPALIDANLKNAAGDIDYVWNLSSLQPKAGVSFGPNRLILPISNTEGFASDVVGNGLRGWSDVQMFEMVDGAVAPKADNARWQLPFQVNLTTAVNPPPASAVANQVSYTIARRAFFKSRTNPDITVAGKYPALATPTISARAGTYERWYVANIGNAQPLTGVNGLPDMHPFHIHLVNFVVTRRWELDANAVGGFNLLPASRLNLDQIARQDTVLVPAGQIVELLVYYPPGFTGEYVYHCHILEHEDKCMMSTFKVA